MKKLLSELALLALVGLAPIGSALAQSCNSNEVQLSMTVNQNTGNNNVALSGRMFCFRESGSFDWGWQEHHGNGGVLTDFKRGANHPTDPTTQVGTWSVSNGLVSHTYGSLPPYTWAVCIPGATGQGAGAANNRAVETCRNSGCTVTLRGPRVLTGLMTAKQDSATPCP